MEKRTDIFTKQEHSINESIAEEERAVVKFLTVTETVTDVVHNTTNITKGGDGVVNDINEGTVEKCGVIVNDNYTQMNSFRKENMLLHENDAEGVNWWHYVECHTDIYIYIEREREIDR